MMSSVKKKIWKIKNQVDKMQKTNKEKKKNEKKETNKKKYKKINKKNPLVNRIIDIKTKIWLSDLAVS